jgi:DNA-binding GntR family transcriptional regulator
MGRKLEALSLGQADKESLQEKVYARLRNAIMSGTLRPGQAASIRGLAAAMGTSPIPVREALQRLSTERALEFLPNGSVAVARMSRDRFLDLRRTRRLVEGFATELAAGRLTKADFRNLDRAFSQLVQHQAKNSLKDFLVANYRLRFVIYHAAGSESLLPIIESLWLQVGPFFNLALSPPALEVTIALQRKAIEALKREDGGAAKRYVEQDLDETARQILDYFERQDETNMPEQEKRESAPSPDDDRMQAGRRNRVAAK